MSYAYISRTSSPLSAWRGGTASVMRQSSECPPDEISHWSSTTTESVDSVSVKESSPIKKTSVLKKIRQGKKSKDTRNSSPVDPAYNSKTQSLESIGNIPGSDEPRSFYDSSSEISSISELGSPVSFHRASKVRLTKPRVVHHGSSPIESVPKGSAPHSTRTNVRPSTSKVTHLLGLRLKNLYNRTSHSGEKRETEHVPGGPSDALKALEGQQSSISEESEEDRTTAVTAPPRMSMKVSRAELTDSTIQAIMEWPDTAARREALDTLPSPLGGFGSIRTPRSDTTSSSETYIYPCNVHVDGLRCNPVIEMDRHLSLGIKAPTCQVSIRQTDHVVSDSREDHALVSENIVQTPYPSRHNSISDSEKVSAANDSRLELCCVGALSHQHQFPSLSSSSSSRSSSSLSPSLNTSADSQDQKGEQNEKANPGPSKSQTSAPAVAIRQLTKFPSLPCTLATFPSTPTPAPIQAPLTSISVSETLFLDLRLAGARSPGAQVTLEIEILGKDKASFDDESLFNFIRDAYRSRLLGWSRRMFCAKKLVDASVGIHDKDPVVDSSRMPRWHGHGPETGNIDGGDFIRHIQDPRLGREQSRWVVWLRRRQSPEASRLSAGKSHVSHRSRICPAPSPVSPLHSIDEMNIPGDGHSKQDSEFQSTISAATTNSTAISPTAVSQPHASHTHRPPSSQPLSNTREDTISTYHPILTLHHAFSPLLILSLFALILVSAVSTAACWIVFGPSYANTSNSADADTGAMRTRIRGDVYQLRETLSSTSNWQSDTQARVGMGLVLGGLVLAVGMVVEAGWIWGSWMLG